jgi:hypothetical protein
MMTQYVVNLNATNPTKITNALKELGEASSKQLTEITQLPRGSVTGVIKVLHEAGMIHISDWKMNKTTMLTRIYKWGPGEDAEEPVLSYAASKRKIFKPRADIAAAWLQNSTQGT